MDLRDVHIFEVQDFADAATAVAALAAVYQDQTPVLRASTARSLTIALRDTRTCAAPRDPDLVAALARHFGTDLAGARDVVSTTRLADRIPCAVMLDHCHALSTWAEVLTTGRRERALLIHADAHDDLGTPSILLTDQHGVFRSILDGDHLDIQDPTSVRRFIRRGFVGIGSFIVPALHAAEGFDILHLIPSIGDGFGFRRQCLQLASKPVEWLGEQGQRPAVCRIDAPSGAYEYSYDQSPDPEAVEAVLKERPVWLDIDLDIFCNRFDTRGAWDVDDAVVLPVMSRFLERLVATGVLHRVAAMTIALSPDFFPARLWPEALTWIDALKAATERAVSENRNDERAL